LERLNVPKFLGGGGLFINRVFGCPGDPNLKKKTSFSGGTLLMATAQQQTREKFPIPRGEFLSRGAPGLVVGRSRMRLLKNTPP